MNPPKVFDEDYINFVIAANSHIGLCIRAFVRIESHCCRERINWSEAKKYKNLCSKVYCFFH